MSRSKTLNTTRWAAKSHGHAGWNRKSAGPVSSDAVLVCSAAVNPIALCSDRHNPDGGSDFREVVLISDGVTEMVDGSRVVLDAEAAAEVIANVKYAGIDLPFDLDHSTLYQAPHGRPAPAMGWVDRDSIHYEAGRGLIGRVAWGEEGASFLHSGSYRYHSPVVRYDKKTKRVRQLYSLALTNTPLTRNARALQAAETN